MCDGGSIHGISGDRFDGKNGCESSGEESQTSGLDESVFSAKFRS